MTQQFCKVGRMRPLSKNEQNLRNLTQRYQSFTQRAAQNLDTSLADFLEGKIKTFKKLIADLNRQQELI